MKKQCERGCLCSCGWGGLAVVAVVAVAITILIRRGPGEGVEGTTVCARRCWGRNLDNLLAKYI